MNRTQQLKQQFAARKGIQMADSAATVELSPNQQADALAKFLSSPAVTAQIARALPRHLTAERLIRIATTELRKTPKLAMCSPQSFLGAVIQCAQLGLEPGSALGHVYLVPFDRWAKVNGRWVIAETVCTVILGYRGMIDLARRSGQIESISAWPVYTGDRFECLLGTDESLVHVPDWENPGRTNPDNLRFVYAVARLKDGGKQFAVMSRAEVELIRARTMAKNRTDLEKYDGPWKSDFEQMALKTVVRRLFKFLPVSVEMVIMDAMRQASSDELALGSAAAAMLEDNPSPTLDIPVERERELEPVQAAQQTQETAGQGGEAGDGQESLATDFDDMAQQRNYDGGLTLGQRIEAALLSGTTRDDIDLAADEIRELSSPDEREKLNALYRERCEVLQ
jgi:recombination protein RecT